MNCRYRRWKTRLPGTVDEHAVEKIQEAVAGGALDGPGRPQVLILDQNFFRGDVEMAANAVGRAVGHASRKRGLRLKVLEIFEGIEQAVGMVNANPGNQPFLDQFKWDAVNGGEYVGVFYPDRGQVVDVEKTAVVDFVGRDPPKAQTIGLIVEQASPGIETVGIAFAAVDRGQHLVAELLLTTSLPSISAAMRRLITSFSRCRSLTLAKSVSSRGGRWERAVSMLSSSSR